VWPLDRSLGTSVSLSVKKALRVGQIQGLGEGRCAGNNIGPGMEQSLLSVGPCHTKVGNTLELRWGVQILGSLGTACGQTLEPDPGRPRI
jgi:hypothetical protein